MRLSVTDKRAEHRLGGGNSLDGVGSPEDLVEDEEMGRRTAACAYQIENRLDFNKVVALSGEQVVGTSYTASNPIDRRFIPGRQAGVDRLCQHNVYTDCPKECGFPRHVGPRDQ